MNGLFHILRMRKGFLTYKTVVQGIKNMKPAEMSDIPVKQKFKSIIEGRAIINLSSEKVFYNPVQEFNRDLSIAVLNVFTEDYKKRKLAEAEKRSNGSFVEDSKVDITILEALSATGLRSIRYAKEVVDATKIIANDVAEEAVETIRNNVLFNNVDHIVETSHEDACMLMYRHKQRSKRFAAVDLDPYGSPTPFLDSAVQSVTDGGLLLVTATDMSVLAGNSPETCYVKYGAVSLRTKCCHEMALRILLQCIEAHANRYYRYIVPLVSVSVDFYIRVFVKVYSGAFFCKQTTSKLSMVYHCVGCHAITLQPLGGLRSIPTGKKPEPKKGYLPTVPPVGEYCDNCNQRHQMGGPIWSAPIHDEEFVARVLSLVQGSRSQFGTAKRLEGVLSVICEEIHDAPLFYTLDRLCGTAHCEMMPILVIRSAILNAGYKVSFSHANRLSIKTKAPNRLIWDIMRTWVAGRSSNRTKVVTIPSCMDTVIDKLRSTDPSYFQQKEDPARRIEANPVTKHILSKPITFRVDLTERDDANPDSRRERQIRFQFNPTPHWGPGCRATINDAENKNVKSLLNQNKRKMMKDLYQKRRLPSPGMEDACKKKTNRQQLVIDTTISEPDSDAGADLVESDSNNDPDEVTHVGTIKNKGSNSIQTDINVGTSETTKVDQQSS